MYGNETLFLPRLSNFKRNGRIVFIIDNLNHSDRGYRKLGLGGQGQELGSGENAASSRNAGVGGERPAYRHPSGAACVEEDGDESSDEDVKSKKKGSVNFGGNLRTANFKQNRRSFKA